MTPSIDTATPLQTVEIRIVPADSMRYDTVADWQFEYDRTGKTLKLSLTVADTGDERSNLAVAIHELTEAWLCRKHGVSEEAVDKFDRANSEADEPGAMQAAPYHREHMIATKVEKAVCKALGLTWNHHDNLVEEVGDRVHAHFGSKP